MKASEKAAKKRKSICQRRNGRGNVFGSASTGGHNAEKKKSSKKKARVLYRLK